MMKRIPMKRTSGSLKRSSGPIKKRKKTQEEIDTQKEEYERDWSFYRVQWALREEKIGWNRFHICESCKQQIWGELKSLYMDHILEKSVYPELRYEPRNMAILCEPCHTRKTNGDVNVVYKQRIEQAKRELIK